MNSPVVSVFMMTYNHEKYIAQALDSILSQTVNFDYEIVVGEDCSSDKTREVVLHYKKKHSEKIEMLLHDRNIGAAKNQIQVLEKCKGKYIAILEGDDFWTDPFKLQKQVDFLESNPEYALIATDVVLVDSEGNLIPDNKMVLKQRALRKEEIGFYDLLQTNLINTLTVCVRSEIMRNLALEAERKNLWFANDNWFWLNIGLKHKIRLSYEKTAAYRVHPGGVSRAINFMQDRTGFIYYDVLIKLFQTTSIRDREFVNKVTLASRCIYLIFSKNLGIREKLYLVWEIVMSPSLFTALIFSLKRKFTRFKVGLVFFL